MLFSRFSKIILASLLTGVFLFLHLGNCIQSEAQLDVECQEKNIEEAEKNLSTGDFRALLEKCKEYCEEEIVQLEKEIGKTQEEKKSLSNQIFILKNKIQSLDYQISQTNIMIKDLSAQIHNTQSSIDKTNLKIEGIKGKLADILQLRYEEDQKSTVEILLAEENLSDFFDNLVALELLNLQTQDLLKNIKDLKSELEGQKQSMDVEKEDLENLVVVQTIQKQESAAKKQEQEYFWTLTEADYQKYLQEKKETQEQVAKISAKLWELLIGVREVPQYGEAVEIAEFISEQTGVRAAFLLGILTQESRIGRNVGQCFLQQDSSGMGIKVKTKEKWPRVMKPDRDVPIFLKIIKELNSAKGLDLDPHSTLVSCWIPLCADTYNIYSAKVDSQGNVLCSGKNQMPYGWGGAMGPAQFIPSTWASYQDKIKKIVGTTPDPWAFRDASLAAALLLEECGALSNERSAAACYFGGWRNRNSSWHLRVYGDPVLTLSKCHQQYIDNGSMSANCKELIF